jgi:hypothetical protein
VHGKGTGTLTEGVLGTSDHNAGVHGITAAGAPYAGVIGESDNGNGTFGRSTNGDGVRGESSGASKSGVVGMSFHAAGYGVAGMNSVRSTNGYLGSDYGAYGKRGDFEGVLGFSDGGVFGRHIPSGRYGYLGMATRAGYFSGDVDINGTLSKSSGSFKIDHPLDPANKYLYHSFVESPEMKNIYDGVVVLDANGEATVTLPSYFESLNEEFRYQLTCIGGCAPVYIAKEITTNSFGIAGGIPGLKVSWQVTGVRHDAYARAHPVVPEVEKRPEERGFFLHPEELGMAATRGIDRQQLLQMLARDDAARGAGAAAGRGN